MRPRAVSPRDGRLIVLGSLNSPFFTFAAFGVGLLVLRAYAEHSRRGRSTFRRMYANERFPQWVRATISLAPVWFVAMALLSVSAVLPRNVAVWVMLIAIDVGAAALALSYRVPQPLMPRWLREEVSEGRTKVARPDRLDWILLWPVLCLFAIGNVAGVILIVAYPAPS